MDYPTVGESQRADTDHWTARVSFFWALIGVAAAGAALRVAYVEVVGPHTRLFADAVWYHLQGLNISHGLGYLDVVRQYRTFGQDPLHATGVPASAFWPPGYPLLLAVVHWLFGDSTHVARLAGACTGAVTITLTGLLGRAVAGARVGLVAAVLVAASPYVIALDGSLMSETLYLPLVLLALLIAQRTRTDTRILLWAAFGAITGLAALTRQDALFLVPFALVPSVLLAPVRGTKALVSLVVMLASLGVIIAPWVLRNADRVGVTTISTTSGSSALAGANCRESYNGAAIGYWVGGCVGFDQGRPTTEARFSRRIRDRAITYAKNHVDRWPAVATARVARSGDSGIRSTRRHARNPRAGTTAGSNSRGSFH